MKNLSIKTQLTLYYGFILSFVCMIVIGVLYTYSVYEIEYRTSNAIYAQVHEATNEIKVKNAKLSFGTDLMKLENGVYLAVYDEQKEMLYGRIPYDFECHDGFHLEMKTSIQNEITYLVYDFPFYPDGKTRLMIRGIANLSDAQSGMNHVFSYSLIFFPLIIVFSLWIGYRASKRALSPVALITSKVKKIMHSKDHQQRIQLGQGKDEIYEMAHTFDELLNQIQEVITREKQFSSDVSHELRTPISVILTQCELLKDETLSEEAKHCLSVIENKANSMHHMISQLLLLSRADAGRAQIDMEELNLSDLCEMTLEEQQAYADTKHIQLTSQIQENIYIQADMTLMIRLLVNLIQNAITYGKEHGNVYLSLTQCDDKITLQIKDNGIGIAQEHLPYIFHRFYQVDHARSSSHSGLGLAMVKWICEIHQAQIQVDSVLNEGTTFTIIMNS